MTDDALLRRFESASLATSEWTHEAHVRVAAMYLSQHGFDEAVARVRQGIRAFNAVHPSSDGPLGGYHETITVAFMRLIYAAMTEEARQGVPFATSSEFCRRHPSLLDKRLILRFYSREAIEHPEARRTLIPPDRAPLPDQLSNDIRFHIAPAPEALRQGHGR